MNPRDRKRTAGVMLVCLLAASGCISRRMTIRTDPPGAIVEVDSERVGLSPVSTDFTYYGTREISMSMPGYETLTVQQPVRTPWYQWIPIDFVSNHFLFGHVTDRHDYVYQLQRKQTPLDEESGLMDRAFNFRSQAQMGAAPRP